MELSEPFDMRCGATGFGVCPVDFQSCFGPSFAPFPPFAMVLYILSHRMLEVCNLTFAFTGVTVKRDCFEYRRDFGL